MNIDERLEKLAERHEALAQSVELLTADIKQLAETVALVLEASARNNEAIANLALIARVHSQRIDRLEKGKR